MRFIFQEIGIYLKLYSLVQITLLTIYTVHRGPGVMIT